MRQRLSLLLGCIAVAAAFQASAQVRLFEHDGFAGRSVNVTRPVRDMSRLGFNDKASSVVGRGGRWTLYEPHQEPLRQPAAGALSAAERDGHE